MISVSTSALAQLEKLMSSENLTFDTHYLRVGVKGGGCSGLSYDMKFDDEVAPNDEQVQTESGLKILVDKKSLLYLFGTELDFSDGLNGKGFHFKNPNASRTCGCGESFAV